MEKKDVGMKIVKRQKTLEQGRVVCYTGLDRHRGGRIGLDRHKARQRWVGLGAVCIFLNPAAKVLTQYVGICTLYPVQPTSV